MRLFFKTVALVLLIFLSTTKASAIYWGVQPAEAGGDAPAEMAMQDIKMPYWANPTYHAFWHSYLLNGRTKQVVAFFYGGNAYNDQYQPEITINKTTYVWTFWHQEVVPLWSMPGLGRSYSVGEGASASFNGAHPVAENKWCRHVMRFWSPVDKSDADKFTFVAWWMKDLEETNQWHVVGVAKIPVPEVRFQSMGLGGFLENFDGQDLKPRGQSYRNLYSRVDGKWNPVKAVNIQSANFLKFSYNKKDDSATIESCGKPFPGGEPPQPANEASKGWSMIAIKEKVLPPMGDLIVKSLGAERFNQNMVIDWALDASSTPQLLSKFEVLDEVGTVVATRYSEIPSLYQLFVELKPEEASRAKSIRITTTDIFDKVATKIVAIHSAPLNSKLVPLSKLDSSKVGFKIDYFDLPKPAPQAKDAKDEKAWNALHDAKGLELARTAFQRQFNLDLMPSAQNLVVFHSFINIPKAGLYRFHLQGPEGARLKIGDVVVVARTYEYSANLQSGWIVLKKGYYPVTCETCADSKRAMALEYEGPGISQMPIPEEAWSIQSKDLPAEELELLASTAKGDDCNLLTFKIGKFKGDQNAIDKITITSGTGETWCTLDMSKSKEEQAKTIFMPASVHHFFPRLFYKNRMVLNLDPITVEVKNAPAKGWTLGKANAQGQRPFGFFASDKRLVLMGDSRSASKKMTGDFVFEGRIKEFVNAVGDPVNTAYAGFGLNASGFNWSYTPYYKGRFATIAHNDAGLNQHNWGNSLHDVVLPCNFKFSRVGNQFKLEIQNNGGKWTTLFEEATPLPATIDFEPYIYQDPGRNPLMFYRVEFDQIKITGGN